MKVYTTTKVEVSRTPNATKKILKYVSYLSFVIAIKVYYNFILLVYLKKLFTKVNKVFLKKIRILD